MVFFNRKKLEKLNRIMIPKIRIHYRSFMNNKKLHPSGTAAVVAPLLFEQELEGDFDVIVAVGCQPGQQIRRLLKRKLPASQVKARIDAQLPVLDKLNLAEYVIWTGGTVAATELQAKAVLRAIQG